MFSVKRHDNRKYPVKIKVRIRGAPYIMYNQSNTVPDTQQLRANITRIKCDIITVWVNVNSYNLETGPESYWTLLYV